MGAQKRQELVEVLETLDMVVLCWRKLWMLLGDHEASERSQLEVYKMWKDQESPASFLLLYNLFRRQCSRLQIKSQKQSIAVLAKYIYTHIHIDVYVYTYGDTNMLLYHEKKKSRPVDSVPGNSTTPPEAPAWRSRPLALEPSVTASELPWQSPIAVGSRVLGECGGRACWETQSLWCKGE